MRRDTHRERLQPRAGEQRHRTVGAARQHQAQRPGPERGGETARGVRGLDLRERGIGILLIEHAIELVMSVADRVIVLNDGRKVADAPPDEVRADRAVLEAYLGHA